MKGKMIWYDNIKAYGFILGDDGQEYFIHRSGIAPTTNVSQLVKGQPVEFDAVYSAPSWQARSLRLFNSLEPVKEELTPIAIKRNPFTPQDPVTDPKKFAGRRDVLRSAVDSLYNTKNILVTGARGIGKSSLSYQLLYMTEGETELLQKLNIDLGEFHFDFLTGDHRCTGDNTLVDIADGLIANLASRAGVTTGVEQGKTVSGINLKIFSSIQEKTSTPITASDLANKFAAEVMRIFLEVKNPPKGICFLIDEVDALRDTTQLGSFLKATVEKFRLDGHLSTCFIVSGVTGAATSLLMQHQSSARLFEGIELERMSNEELQEVVDITLADTGVNIESQASSLMVSLANNFPQPLHLLGYHSFRLNDDDIIGKEDVERAKTYIVQHGLRQYYDDKLRSLDSPLMKDIVRAISSASSPTVNVLYLSKRMPHASEHTILSLLGELVKVDILEKHGRFSFSFREPLFGIYCKWVFWAERQTQRL
jgi:cold shock CspA family protein/predicted AAA+ superfamily ATPase